MVGEMGIFFPFAALCCEEGRGPGVGAFPWEEVMGNNLIFVSFWEGSALLDSVFE